MNGLRWIKRSHREHFAIGCVRKTDVRTPVDVTVIIPSFNHEAFIEEALRSVLGQTYGGSRVVVVDDASSDGTVNRAISIRDPRITMRVNPRNMGLGNCIISILPDIDTPMVALLNSDDLFHAERLARCCDVLRNSPKTQIVATDICLIDSEGGRLRADNVSPIRDGRKIYYWVRWFEKVQLGQDAQIPLFIRLLKNNILATSSNIVCRTDYLRNCSENIRDLHYCLDWQLFLNASMNDRLAYLREELVAYRLHARNTVWFTGLTRRRYLTEVNRVAAQSLYQLILSLMESGVERSEREVILRDALLHLAANANLRRFGLFLDQLCQRVDCPSSRIDEIRELLGKIARENYFKHKWTWAGFATCERQNPFKY